GHGGRVWGSGKMGGGGGRGWGGAVPPTLFGGGGGAPSPAKRDVWTGRRPVQTSLEETMCCRDYAPPLELADQADEPPPLGRLVGYRQRRDQQLDDFGRQ